MSHSDREVTRILLIDSQLTLRAGLRLLIHQRPFTKVVLEASDITEALSLLDQQPDIAIINLYLPGHAENLAELIKLAQQTYVILLVSQQDIEIFYRSLGEVIQAGIKGIVFREDPEETLGIAIDRVAGGGVWLESSTLARVLGKIVLINNSQKNDPAASRLKELTSREREIVTLVGKGMKNKQIAARLTLSEATIRHYLTSIFNKLEVADRVALAIFAYRWGLTQPDTDQPASIQSTLSQLNINKI